MSWIKENYEKAALGGAGIIALGIGAMILLGGGEESGGAKRNIEPDNNAEVASAAELARTLGIQSTDQNFREPDRSGRSVGLFVGQRLYAKEGSKDPVDLMESGPVHEGIPNPWFSRYDLDPGYANAPERDSDGDGFTEREEHDADTSPIDDSSHPPAINKLAGVSVDAFRYRIRWSVFADEQITLRYIDIKNNSFSQQAAPGDLVFEEEPMKGRFKLGEKFSAKDARGNMQDAYPLIDQDPLTKGKKLTLLKRGPEAGGNNEFSDYSATLRLSALGQADKPFTLKEGERFSLPFDPKAASKPYLLKQIEPTGDGQFLLHLEYDNEGKTELKKLEDIPAEKK